MVAELTVRFIGGRPVVYRYNQQYLVDLIHEGIETKAKAFFKLLNIVAKTIRMDSLSFSFVFVIISEAAWS